MSAAPAGPGSQKQAAAVPRRPGSHKQAAPVARRAAWEETPGVDVAQMRAARNFKEEADEAWRNSQFEHGAALYSKALETLRFEEDTAAEQAMCCLNRAACNMQVHEYGQVIADCCQVLDWDADNVTAYLRRGLAYEGSRRFSKAAADMREALSIQSASGGLRHTLAKKAKECLERCVKAEPELREIPIPTRARITPPAHQQHPETIVVDTWEAPDESAAQSPAVLEQQLLHTRLLFHLKERLVPPDGNCLLHCVHGHCETLRALWLKYRLGRFPSHIPKTVHGWRNALMQRVEAKKSQLLQLQHGVLESMLLREGQKQTTTEKQDNDLVATFLRLNRKDQVWLPNFCLHIAAEMLHEIHLPAMLVDSAGNLIRVRVFRVDPMVQDPAATETTPMLPVHRILPPTLDDLGREPVPAARRHRPAPNFNLNTPIVHVHDRTRPDIFSLVVRNKNNNHWDAEQVLDDISTKPPCLLLHESISNNLSTWKQDNKQDEIIADQAVQSGAVTRQAANANARYLQVLSCTCAD